MAFAHGKDSVLLITDAAATEQDISKYFDNIPPAISRAMSEVSAFGDKGQRFIPGLQGASFDVEGHFDPAIHTILSELFDKEDAPTQLVFGPAGSAVGMPKMSMVPFSTSHTSAASLLPRPWQLRNSQAWRPGIISDTA